jgi:hypothetical protein
MSSVFPEGLGMATVSSCAAGGRQYMSLCCRWQAVYVLVLKVAGSICPCIVGSGVVWFGDLLGLCPRVADSLELWKLAT